MNSSIRQTINIVTDCLVISLSSVNICLSAALFGFIIYRIMIVKNSPNRVALLLTANMYLSITLCCILLLREYAYTFSGHLHLLIPTKDRIYCQVDTYFILVSIAGIFYSICLQSIYRLCRVVYHTKQSLQSFQVYLILILIQWIICFLVIIPGLLLGDFQYINDDYFCQVDYTNLRTAVTSSLLVYGIPMNTTIGCYIYTWKKMRRGNNSLTQTMTQIQQISAHRDLVVLFRICVLLGLLITISIPGLTVILTNILTGSPPWWSSIIQSLGFNLSISSVTISSALIFPHVRNLWAKNPQHHSRVIPAVISIH